MVFKIGFFNSNSDSDVVVEDYDSQKNVERG